MHKQFTESFILHSRKNGRQKSGGNETDKIMRQSASQDNSKVHVPYCA